MTFERKLARVSWKLSQFFFFRKKLSRLEHVLFLKVSFASYLWKRLSKENFLMCHYHYSSVSVTGQKVWRNQITTSWIVAKEVIYYLLCPCVCAVPYTTEALWLPGLFIGRPHSLELSLSQILSGTRPSVRTVSNACLRRTCLLDTSVLSALEVVWQLLRYINLLTYLLTYLLT